MKCITIDCGYEQSGGEPYCQRCQRLLAMLINEGSPLRVFVDRGYAGLRRVLDNVTVAFEPELKR